MQYAKFRANEWGEVTRKASMRFIREVLGKKPTAEEVKKEIRNPHTITALEWAAMVVLVVLTIFTSFKVGALAVPFAEGALVTLTQHTYIDPNIGWWFKLVTAGLFILLATPALIYFKLLDKEPEIVTEKAETRITLDSWRSLPRLFKALTLDVISPRLPYALVYGVVAWLVYVSLRLPGTIFEQLLPVVAEVGLAILVGNILRKRQESDKVLYTALAERLEPWQQRKTEHQKDPAYLRILYQEMREALTVLERTDEKRTRLHPNLWLENASAEEVDTVIVAEYKRLTGGLSFADKVTEPVVLQLDVVETGTAGRRPPRNAERWTPETLLTDLLARGITPGKYNEGNLRVDYAPGYDVRKAWRGGAKAQFEATA